MPTSWSRELDQALQTLGDKFVGNTRTLYGPSNEYANPTSGEVGPHSTTTSRSHTLPLAPWRQDPEAILSIGTDFTKVMAAARAGTPRAFEVLYAEMAPPITAYLRAQGVHDPDDLASEVFLNVFRKLQSFNGTENQFRRWVFNIAYRRVVDEYRRGRRRPLTTSIAGTLDNQIGNSEDDALNELGSQRVIELCSELAPDQRNVLLLRIMADLSIGEVADTIGKSKGAVKALQRRGLEALRQRLDREGGSS